MPHLNVIDAHDKNNKLLQINTRQENETKSSRLFTGKIANSKICLIYRIFNRPAFRTLNVQIKVLNNAQIGTGTSSLDIQVVTFTLCTEIVSRHIQTSLTYINRYGNHALGIILMYVYCLPMPPHSSHRCRLFHLFVNRLACVTTLVYSHS